MTEIENEKLPSGQQQLNDEKCTEGLKQSESTEANVKKAPKRKKMKKLVAEEETIAENNDNDNLMPTPVPSKRQKKRQKHAQLVVRSKDKEVEKTIAYLTKWDINRTEWKYEKLRQIYIQKNIFDDGTIPEEHSDAAIRYLATSKGHARTIIIEAAETKMKEIENQITDDNQEELTSSVQYERARKILQSMQD